MKTSIYLIISLVMVTNVSCQNNHTDFNNNIATLNANPITITQSSFRFDNGSVQMVETLSDEEIDGKGFIISNRV